MVVSAHEDSADSAPKIHVPRSGPVHAGLQGVGLERNTVEAIMYALIDNQPPKIIARQYGVSGSTVYSIKQGDHALQNESDRRMMKEANIKAHRYRGGKFPISIDKLRQVHDLLSTTKLTHAQIAQQTGVSQTTVSAVRHGHKGAALAGLPAVKVRPAGADARGKYTPKVRAIRPTSAARLPASPVSAQQPTLPPAPAPAPQAAPDQQDYIIWLERKVLRLTREIEMLRGES